MPKAEWRGGKEVKYNVTVTTTITNYFEIEASDTEVVRLDALSEQVDTIKEMRFGEFAECSTYEITEAEATK